MLDLAIHSKNTLLSGELKDATIFIKAGKIIDIVQGLPEHLDCPVEDVGNSVLMPGIIDSHVHINEPGRTEWEGFDTATKAAAAGGITTLVEMPLNSNPVTTTLEGFQQKLEATKGKLHVNCGFWGGIVPGNVNDLDKLINAGVLGIKAFLIHSGIDDFPNVTEEDLRKGMPAIAKYDVPLLVHSELNTDNSSPFKQGIDPRSYDNYLNSRPKSWEDNAIKLMIGLCREYNCRTHIVHLSSANSLSQLKAAREEGLPLTVETCPHYLVFCAEDITDGDTRYKCAPPIREKTNNELLWQALKDGTIDFIVTDHSPSAPELKLLDSGNFIDAWGGIAGLQFSLPVIWTEARKRDFTIADISSLMSTKIAQFIGIDDRKGKIAPGYDADLVVWDPEKSFTVEKSMIQHRHKITPYEGKTLHGVVEQTYVNGKKVYDQGAFVSLHNGELLLRK